MTTGGESMDPVTGIVAAGKAVDAVSKSGLVQRLVGPYFDEVGAIWAEGARQRNTEKLVRKAAKKAKNMERPGAIPMRLAHQLFDEGAFVDDDVMQEYLAGLLGGSRSDRGVDDRGTYYVDMLVGMSSAQVRLHHAIYEVVASGFGGEDLGDANELQRFVIVAPEVIAGEVVSPPEGVDLTDALGEAIMGLRREGLIDDYGVATGARLGLDDDNEKRLFFVTPTQVGCFLALWAHGFSDANLGAFNRIAPCNFEEPGPTFATVELRTSKYRGFSSTESTDGSSTPPPLSGDDAASQTGSQVPTDPL